MPQPISVHFSLTVSASVVAWYAAIVSTVSGAIQYANHRRDRVRLKISVHIRRLVQTPHGQEYFVAPNLPVDGRSEQLFLVMDVTNVGRRPTRWVGWGGKRRMPEGGRDSFVIAPVGLPKMLNEGESHTEFTPQNPDNINRLFIWDSTGKNRYVSRHALRKLKHEYRKAQS
jgi:hypothetical protein